MEFQPFYPGQKVIALSTSKKRDGMQVIKDQIYTVYECFIYSCGKWCVSLKELHSPYLFNVFCHTKEKEYAGGNAKFFAPIETTFQSISLSKVLEVETPFISVN